MLRSAGPSLVGIVPTTGTALIDFGDTPTSEASISVTGQTGITAGSSVRVWLQGDVMGNNDADDHVLASETVRFVNSLPEAGVGFVIYAFSELALWTKRFRVRWRWT